MKHLTCTVLLSMLLTISITNLSAQTRAKSRKTTTTNAAVAQEFKQGTIVYEQFHSTILRNTLTGLDTNRTIGIYLPPGYYHSTKKYPVVYYFLALNHTPKQMLTEGNVIKLVERAFSTKSIGEFIFVFADYTSPTLGSWFENSTTTGRWLDYTADEIVPFIDQHFRTIATRESRALTGDFIGGYAALKFAMFYPDLFSVAYAMHPVGTGTGISPGYTKADWRKIHQAKTFKDLENVAYGPPFVVMAQGYLPNPSRPPFFCDFMAEMINGEPVVNMANVKKWEKDFLLDQLLMEKSENLSRVHIGFDWGRYDPNIDHVYANQAFTRKLDEMGIEHIGEEYNGLPWEKTWTDTGRFYTRLLPFLEQYLVFEEKK